MDLSILMHLNLKQVATDRRRKFRATPQKAPVLCRSLHHQEFTRPRMQEQDPMLRSKGTAVSRGGGRLLPEKQLADRTEQACISRVAGAR